MFEDLNYQRPTIKKGINTRELEFAPLSNFIGAEIPVDGFFFTSSKYGKQVVVVGRGYNINMPKRAVEAFEKISNDDAKVDAVLAGHLKLVDIKEVETSNGKTVSYTFKDC